MESVAGKVVERAACDLYLFSAGVMAFDIAVFRKLFLDLYQILLQPCDIHGGTDGFQMVDLRLCLRELFRDGLVGPFQMFKLLRQCGNYDPSGSDDDSPGERKAVFR